MGGPNTLDEVKVFLQNMFNDKAIINSPKPIRKLISFIIIKSRLKQATLNYKALGGKSPMISHTQKLVKSLIDTLGIDVFYINRYVPPYASEVLSYIKDYDEFICVPMYPHYSKTTTGSSVDDILFQANKLDIHNKKFKIIEPYYDNKIYNKILLTRIKESLNADNPKDYEIIFSAHGLPQKVIDNGDIYQKHIKLNVLYIRKLLLQNGIEFDNTHVSYQSRLGPVQWLKPYLEDTLIRLKKDKVIIVPISFTLDNSETQYELDIEYKKIANKLGILDYRVAKAPNELMLNLIVDLVKGYL